MAPAYSQTWLRFGCVLNPLRNMALWQCGPQRWLSFNSLGVNDGGFLFEWGRASSFFLECKVADLSLFPDNYFPQRTPCLSYFCAIQRATIIRLPCLCTAACEQLTRTLRAWRKGSIAQQATNPKPALRPQAGRPALAQQQPPTKRKALAQSAAINPGAAELAVKIPARRATAPISVARGAAEAQGMGAARLAATSPLGCTLGLRPAAALAGALAHLPLTPCLTAEGEAEVAKAQAACRQLMASLAAWLLVSSGLLLS